MRKVAVIWILGGVQGVPVLGCECELRSGVNIWLLDQYQVPVLLVGGVNE